jgi:hypothetical protein
LTAMNFCPAFLSPGIIVYSAILSSFSANAILDHVAHSLTIILR